MEIKRWNGQSVNKATMEKDRSGGGYHYSRSRYLFAVCRASLRITRSSVYWPGDAFYEKGLERGAANGLFELIHFAVESIPK